MNSDINPNSENILDSFFGSSAKAQAFLTNDFQKRPFVVKGSAKRLKSLKDMLFNLDVLEMLEHTASDDYQVWLATKNSDKSLDSIKVSDASQGNKLILVFLLYT